MGRSSLVEGKQRRNAPRRQSSSLKAWRIERRDPSSPDFVPVPDLCSEYTAILGARGPVFCPLQDASFIARMEHPSAQASPSLMSDSEMDTVVSFTGARQWGDTSDGLNSYRILEPISEGARAVMYRAEELTSKDPIVVRFVLGESTNVALELQATGLRLAAAAQLEHPNLVRVLDLAHVDGCHFIATEFVDGPDLGTYVRQHGPLSALQALELGRDIALALAEIHDTGQTHGYVRPDRVFLDPNQGARLSGLGVPSKDEETEVGTLIPEEMLSDDVSTPKDDLYALGGVIYWSLMGSTFTGASDLRSFGSDFPALEPDAVDLLCSLLSPHIKDRPSSAAVVARRWADAVDAASDLGRRRRQIALRILTAGGVGAASSMVWQLGVGRTLFGLPSAVGVLLGTVSVILGLSTIDRLIKNIPRFSSHIRPWWPRWLVRALSNLAILIAGGALMAEPLSPRPNGIDTILAGLGLVMTLGVGAHSGTDWLRHASAWRAILKRWVQQLLVAGFTLAVLRWTALAYFSV